MVKPSQRFKKRYVSFMFTVDGKPPAYAVAKECVHTHILSFFGELGVSSLAFKFVKYHDGTGKGLIRCAKDKVDETLFSMACLSSCNKAPARLMPLSVGGTIKRT